MTASRRTWIVWSTGVGAYLVGVMHRTSFGVAGLDARERFDTSASVLASFAVLQLLVYALLQVPVGVVLDRVGPRRLIAIGATLMAAGQLVLAVADTVTVAVVARVMVGAGDAMTFLSVLRLVPAWFPTRQVPLITQLTGITGQLGQILSAVPLVALLHGPGWSPAFGSAAALGLLAAVLTLALVRDAPAGAQRPSRSPSIGDVGRELVSAWKHPGTRLGLWTHFTTQFSGTVFALMWGYPYLVSGQGLTPAAASTLLTVFVLAGMVAAPVMGVLVGRHPLRRSWLVLGITGATALAWAIVLALSEPAPAWLLVGLVLVLALGGPGSMIGFDFARTFNPMQRMGTASGIVNVGGFFASLTTIQIFGVILDWRTPGDSDAYTLDAFRAAWSVQFVIWAIGVGGILRTRHLVRQRMAREGVVVPPIREAIARNRARRNADR
jgi:MFS family permease